MDNEIVVISSDLEQTEVRIRRLVDRTLAPLESVIDIIAVKIDHDMFAVYGALAKIAVLYCKRIKDYSCIACAKC